MRYAPVRGLESCIMTQITRQVITISCLPASEDPLSERTFGTTVVVLFVVKSCQLVVCLRQNTKPLRLCGELSGLFQMGNCFLAVACFRFQLSKLHLKFSLVTQVAA